MVNSLYENRVKAIDSQDLSGVLALMTDDHVLVVGNGDPIHGKEIAGKMMKEFWSSISTVKHSIQSVREDGDTAFVEALVDYQRLDGRAVRVRVCEALVMKDDKIRETRAYIDLSPLWE